MDSSLFVVAARTAGGFIALLILTRLLGKKQLSHLTFFNYVTGITFGSITAAVIVDVRIPALTGLTSLAVWSILAFVTGYLSLKSPKIRVLVDGEPTIVIKRGKVLEKALQGLRINMDDLSMLLRKKNVFSIQEVDYAIYEPDGELSVFKKTGFQAVTKTDMHIPFNRPQYIPTEIIVDGKVVSQNLKELGLSEGWLDQQLTGAGIHDLEQVFYAEIQEDGTLHIDRRQDNVH